MFVVILAKCSHNHCASQMADYLHFSQNRPDSSAQGDIDHSTVIEHVCIYACMQVLEGRYALGEN